MVNQKQVQPLVAAYVARSKKEQDRIKRANKPEIIWETVFSLLSEKNQVLLKNELLQMGIKPNKTAICSIHSNEEWAVATNEGRRPFVIIGKQNFVLCGMVNGKPKRNILSGGPVPPNPKIYADLANDESIFVAFPESNVSCHRIRERVR